MNRSFAKTITYICLSVFILVFGMKQAYAATADITAEAVLASVNETRVNNGLQPLTMNVRLNEAAKAKGADMQSYGYWAHTNPTTKETGWTFIRSTGYQYAGAGENLAKDYTDVSGVIHGWLNSPTHRSIMLSDKYSETGIAVIVYKTNGIEKALIVQLFARPVPKAKPITSSFTALFERVLNSIAL